ncbi:MAG: sugar ABC transporter permease [Clostridia bacterium]|nr:sugar ABC transporter permease [Clostridia bacterium]MBQ8405298.1 sugar ABC transporter permease [Clostridia bacterium]
MTQNDVREQSVETGASFGTPPPTIKRRKGFFTIRKVFILFALAPALIHLLIFWLGVQIESLMMAFENAETGEFWLGNFEYVVQALGDTREPLGEGFRNTLIFFAVSICMVPVSIFAVYLIYKKCFGYGVVRILLYLPGAVSGIMMAMLFKNLVGPNGPLKWFLNDILNLGITDSFIYSTNYALKTIIVYDIWMGLGGNLIIWLGAMGRIPPDVIEYGKLDGVGPVKEFFFIIVPLIWPTLCTMLTLHIIGIFGSSGSVMVFTEGKYGTYTISYWLYHVVYSDASSSVMQNYAVAAGLFFTVLTVPLVVVGRWFMNKFGDAVEY